MTHKKTLKYEVYNYSHSNCMLDMSEYKINGSPGWDPPYLVPCPCRLVSSLTHMPPEAWGKGVGTVGPLSRCIPSVSHYWDDWDVKDGDRESRCCQRESIPRWWGGGLALINPKIHLLCSIHRPHECCYALYQWPRWRREKLKMTQMKMQRKTSTESCIKGRQARWPMSLHPAFQKHVNFM